MEVNKDVHFFWLNTEMIGISRQLKSISTETEIDRHTMGYACLMGEKLGSVCFNKNYTILQAILHCIYIVERKKDTTRVICLLLFL